MATRNILSAGRLRVGFIVLACFVLGWAVVSETVADALAESDPRAALNIRPGYAPALQPIAEEAVANAVTSDEIKQAVRVAQGSLKASPLSPVSLRAVASAKQLTGDAEGAGKLMALAGRRNLRDAGVQLWLFNQGLQRENYADAFKHADLLVRRRSDSAGVVYPALLSALDRPGAVEALISLFSTGPSWRADFLRALSEGGDEAEVGLRVLTALRGSVHPASAQEVQPIIARLIARGRYEQAREIWQSLSPRARSQPMLYDGDFEQPRGAPPLDWRFIQSAGASAIVERMEGGAPGHALYAEYQTGAAPVLAEQLLVLPEGAYKLTGRSKIDRMPEEGSLTWSLTCVPSGQSLAAVAAKAVTPWRTFSANFQTPGPGCEAQWLRLTGSFSSTYDNAGGWFDDLEVVAMARGSAAPSAGQAAP